MLTRADIDTATATPPEELTRELARRLIDARPEETLHERGATAAYLYALQCQEAALMTAEEVGRRLVAFIDEATAYEAEEAAAHEADAWREAIAALQARRRATPPREHRGDAAAPLDADPEALQAGGLAYRRGALMPTPEPLPWLDHTPPHALLRVFVNGPDVVVATKGTLDIDLVHVRGGRTRTLSVLGDDELRAELDAIARGERMPPE